MTTVLIVGSGGREHALGHVLAKSAVMPDLLFAPGNAGTESLGENLPILADQIPELVAIAVQRKVDLVIVGPEAPLVAGLADALREENIAVLGPDQAAAKLEGSKAFAKEIMDEGKIPTARWLRCKSMEEAMSFTRHLGGKVAVKADGLAGGKGVIVCDDEAIAHGAINTLWGKHGYLIVEEKLEGEELSVIALVDGENIALLAPAQDHKRVGEGDTGPNTGGMGAYAPAPRGTPELLAQIEAQCLRPVIDVLRRRGIKFQGFLFVGLMLTADGPKVLEYNVRLGDPETQVILPLLDVDAYELFLSAATGSLKPGIIPLKTMTAVTVVLASEGYPASPRIGDAIQGLDDLDDENVIVFQAATERKEGQLLTSGGRVLAVSALDETLEASVAGAYRAVEKISWPGMHFRRDIAHRALRRKEEARP
jgi:phosphoribosylamine--glycine ligase